MVSVLGFIIHLLKINDFVEFLGILGAKFELIEADGFM